MLALACNYRVTIDGLKRKILILRRTGAMSNSKETGHGYYNHPNQKTGEKTKVKSFPGFTLSIFHPVSLPNCSNSSCVLSLPARNAIVYTSEEIIYLDFDECDSLPYPLLSRSPLLLFPNFLIEDRTISVF
jgi:hypothetical protein